MVGLGHVVVLVLLWVSRVPMERKNTVPDVGLNIFFLTSAADRRLGEQSRRPTPISLLVTTPKAEVSELLQSTIARVAILPPLPESSAPSGIGWQNEVADVASDLIERARVEADRPMNRPLRSPSFSPLHEKPHTLEWISQHSHEVIDEHGVPQWVLVQPCESALLVQKPDCTVERVLRRGILFEYMTEQHDATLQYGGPNAIP
jgi:hypothetical protein